MNMKHASQQADQCTLQAAQCTSNSDMCCRVMLQGPLPASAAVRQFLPAQSPYQQQPLPAPAAAAAAAAGQPSRPSNPAAAAAALPQQQQERGVAAGHHAHRNLSPDRIWLLKMYGRVYLAHADTVGNRLELYRFYTDTIILQHVYELVSPKVRNIVEHPANICCWCLHLSVM
jgi:hypothetical protein